MNEGSSYLAGSIEAYIALSSVPAYLLSTLDFTVEAWVKTYSGGPVMGVLATENSLGFYLLLNAGSIEFNMQDETSYDKGRVSGISVCNGMWHHVALLGVVRIYWCSSIPSPSQWMNRRIGVRR